MSTALKRCKLKVTAFLSPRDKRKPHSVWEEHTPCRTQTRQCPVRIWHSLTQLHLRSNAKDTAKTDEATRETPKYKTHIQLTGFHIWWLLPTHAVFFFMKHMYSIILQSKFLKKNKMRNKGTHGNSCRWRICVLPYLWWQHHGCKHMSKLIILYTLNMYSFLYINYNLNKVEKIKKFL